LPLSIEFTVYLNDIAAGVVGYAVNKLLNLSEQKRGNIKMAIKWLTVGGNVKTLIKIGGCPIQGEPRQEKN